MTTSKNTKPKIVVIDDEKGLLRAIETTLKKEGYQVETAETGKAGLAVSERVRPDLILLDLRLPDIDGYDVCKKLKAEEATSSTPIIMITTRSRDTEKVIGLEIGADDYITKPYNPSELVARVRAMLRRNKVLVESIEKPKSKYQFRTLEVETDSRKVSLNSKKIKLTPKEFDLLVMLISHPGKVYSRNSLMTSIWGRSYNSLHGTVDYHISCLRKKLGSAGKWLLTVPSIGYQWTEEEA